MKKVFFGLIIQLLFVINLQAATFYSSPDGYWCLARNGKSYCFKTFPVNNIDHTFIVDRGINLEGYVKLQGNLIIEEEGILNIVGDGSLELEGMLEIHFAGVLNVNKNLIFAENSKVSVDRYAEINVLGNFTNYSFSGDIQIDGKLEVLGNFENQGIIAGLGKVITPGNCIPYPGALTFGHSSCDGINMFTLPVSLLNFEAKVLKQEVALTWSTSKEANFEYFEVERAAGNNNFENIGRVSGKGNNSQLNSYAFTDKNPHSGKNIYRLKSIDKDGSIEYFEPVVVHHFPASQKNLSIYPNPLVGDQLHINLNFNPEENTKIAVYNSQGKLFFNQDISSTQQIIYLKHSLEPGLYIVLLENQGTKLREKLIVN